MAPGIETGKFYFRFNANGGLTDGHCVWRVKFPDGQIYYIDSGDIEKGGISTPPQVQKNHPGWEPWNGPGKW